MLRAFLSDTKGLTGRTIMVKRLIFLVVALGLLFGGIFGWKANQARLVKEQRASATRPAVTVSSAVANLESWRVTVSAVGSLSANQGVEVSAEVPGIVAGISFESGHSVSEGELLVQLDAAAELAELRSLKAQVELARLDYERARGLIRNTAVSQAELDRDRTVLESLSAQTDEQEVFIARKEVRAPFTGVLGIRKINKGQYLSPGTAIVTLQNLNPVYVDFTLPERFLQNLKVDQVVELNVSAYPDETFSGLLTAISPKVEEKTRNVPLQATFKNTALRLRPGMFARISVVMGEKEGVVALPRTAISTQPYGDSVFVIEAEGDDLIVQRRQVVVGQVRGNKVEVLSGLASGEQVVATGQMKLRSGQRVRIDNSVSLPSGLTSG
ncbi:MAG: efflux transporter periplasmic adaptor subunit [Gammaproteobacteria bacterium]|nr:efflux transporter periplasmic adaptor subunit [Gammaproteobacteria bacterium]